MTPGQFSVTHHAQKKGKTSGKRFQNPYDGLQPLFAVNFLILLDRRPYAPIAPDRRDCRLNRHTFGNDIGFGHQIRSYVLHPYQMIKDLRTGHQTSDSQGVLDGDLDPFLQASLSSKLENDGGTRQAFADID